MTAPQSTTTAESSLWREARDIARYHLGNRWVLAALGAVVLVAGIGLNWGWLVAAGRPRADHSEHVALPYHVRARSMHAVPLPQKANDRIT